MAIAEIAPLLAREREDIVPLIGAGLAVAAGLPSADALAEVLRRRCGQDLDAAPGDFGAVCREIERLKGLAELQRLAADAIQAVEAGPTSSLAAIARCPSAVVLTSNFDGAIERSVEEIGKRAVRLCLDDPRIGEGPRDGEVFVVHLHGVAQKPETMILTTAQRDALLADEGFRSRLRSLILGRRVIALGLRLSVEEPHLRAELRTIGRLAQERLPLVVLPEPEVDEELSILERDRQIELHRCDSSQDYLEVRQCAQLIAPRQLDRTETISAQAERVAPPFLSPPLLGPRQLADSPDRELSVSAMMAESHLGSWAELEELAEAQRAVLIAAPGQGKTWTLRALGEANAGRAVLCDLRDLRPDDEEPTRAFARLVARAGTAFDQRTAAPSLEMLREGGYLFLLDSLEEALLTDHEAVVTAILAAAERWPQHSYVVATRPTSEAQRLLDAGFARFALEGSESWGRRYLLASGITEEQVEHLFDVAPTIGPQLAIPRYAARIAAELREETEGVALSRGALERLARGERKNLEESSQRLGIELSELVSWARRLAAMIELRGESSAAIEEIATLPGPEGRSSRSTCEELVQVALLQDLPAHARFSAKVSQEALCAEAILASEDPYAALEAVAVAEIDERAVLRDDIEHTLDLVFEGAPTELRSRLRELDELRWARTAQGGDQAEAAEAIEVIRLWHHERRLWIPLRGDNQLRGPGEAVKALHHAAPQALESRRAELYAECRDDERTVRGNAVELLTLLPTAEETEGVLRELLTDPDDVVRRHAAHAVDHFKLADLTGELWDAYDRETDELALQAIGLALAALCTQQELTAGVGRLRKTRRGWQRISYAVLPRIELSALNDLLASGSVGLEDVEEVLGGRLEQPDLLSGEEVQALGGVLLRGGPRLHHGKHGERIAAEIAAHPEEALRGAEVAVEEDTSFLDLAWATSINREVLARFGDGPLASQVEVLLERIRWGEEVRGQGPLDSEELAEEEEEAEEPQTLAAVLDELGEHNVPTDYWLRRLPEEDEDVQERVLELAEQWYPAEPPETLTNGFSGAVATWVALDRPIGEERWMAILGVGLSRFHGAVAEWMSQQWEDDWSEEAAERISGLERADDIALAAKAVPSWPTGLRALFIERATSLVDESLAITVIGHLGEQSDSEGLRTLLAGVDDETVEDRALRELAQLGDVDAQRRLLKGLLALVQADPGSAHHHEARWLGTLESPQLIGILGSILRATHRSEDASFFRRIVEGGIQNIGDESCLALYDELIADSDLPGGQFYWYQRETLVRSLARQAVLERLGHDGHELVE